MQSPATASPRTRAQNRAGPWSGTPALLSPLHGEHGSQHGPGCVNNDSSSPPDVSKAEPPKAEAAGSAPLSHEGSDPRPPHGHCGPGAAGLRVVLGQAGPSRAGPLSRRRARGSSEERRGMWASQGWGPQRGDTEPRSPPGLAVSAAPARMFGVGRAARRDPLTSARRSVAGGAGAAHPARTGPRPPLRLPARRPPRPAPWAPPISERAGRE